MRHKGLYFIIEHYICFIIFWGLNLHFEMALLSPPSEQTEESTEALKDTVFPLSELKEQGFFSENRVQLLPKTTQSFSTISPDEEIYFGIDALIGDGHALGLDAVYREDDQGNLL